MRNPFRKQDENARPAVNKALGSSEVLAIDIKDKNPVEYKLSEINDSGVYLPPSPTERKSFWGTTSSRSTTSSSINRCAFNENEPFNISRESFDSYRRSFDISARSPVIMPETRQRASLDNRTFLPPSRSSNSFSRPVQVPQTQQEEVSGAGLDRFEDVSIDEPRPLTAQPPAKKRGILSRIVDSAGDEQTTARPASSHENKSAWHHFGGRKRAPSVQGAELGSIVPQRDETPKPEKQQQQQQKRLEQQQQQQQQQQSPYQPEPPSSSSQLAPPPQPRILPQQQKQPNAQIPKAPKIEFTQAPGIQVDS